MADFGTAFDNNPKLTAYIPDGSGAGSWPITGYTYLILHTTSMSDCVKAQAIVDFIKWAQTDPTAQKAATTSDTPFCRTPSAPKSSPHLARLLATANP